MRLQTLLKYFMQNAYLMNSRDLGLDIPTPTHKRLQLLLSENLALSTKSLCQKKNCSSLINNN